MDEFTYSQFEAVDRFELTPRKQVYLFTPDKRLFAVRKIAYQM